MTTKEQMAIDVFSEGVEYSPNLDGSIRVWHHTWKQGNCYSDYEMAELNDLACDIFEQRLFQSDINCTKFLDFYTWRLEGE